MTASRVEKLKLALKELEMLKEQREDDRRNFHLAQQAEKEKFERENEAEREKLEIEKVSEKEKYEREKEKSERDR